MPQKNEKIETNGKKRVREIKMILGDFSMWKHLLFSMSSVFIAFLMGGIINSYFPKILFVDYKISQNELIKFPVCLIEILFVVAFIIFQKKYKYRFSTIQYYVTFYAIAIYGYMRFGAYETKLDFHNLIGEIKYFDAPFVLLALSFLFSAIRDLFVKKKELIRNTFLEDNPLCAKEDLSQFDNLVKQIEPALFKDKYDRAFSIGIIGPWGSGKSSFVGAVKERIKDHKDYERKVLYISFSPFLNHNEDRVIHEFFVQLSNELKKRSGKLSNLLLSYSAKLSNAIKDSNPISFLKPSGITKEDESVGELYDEIETVIKSLKLKIIISIDDLDRLNAKEILQVLKLIRNTSNFPNVVFLVAMDKEYIVNSIAENNEKQRKFIDKFFQLEVHVSRPPFDKVKDYAISNVLNGLRNNGLNDFNITELNNSFKIHELNLHKFIVNYRDAKRFVNQFIYDFRLMHENEINVKEIEYFDFCVLTLFKIFCQDEFYSIKDGKENLLKRSERYADILFYDFELNSEKIANHINEILQKVFPRNGNSEFVDLKRTPSRSIAFEKVLRLYFERTLPQDELNEFEFSQIYDVEDLDSVLIKVIDLSRTPKRLDSFIMILLNREVESISAKYYKTRVLMHAVNFKEYFDFTLYNRFFALLIELYNSNSTTFQFDVINKAFSTEEYSSLFKANLLVGLSNIDDYEKMTKRKVLDDAANILHKFTTIDTDHQFYLSYEEFKETFNTLWNIKSIHKDLVEYTTEEIVKPNALNFINCIIVNDEDISHWKFDPITFKLFKDYNLIQDLGNDSIDKSSDALLEYFDFLMLNALVNWKKSIIYEFKYLKPYWGLSKDINVLSEFGEIVFECRSGFKDKIKDTAIFFDFCAEHKGINYYQFRTKDYWVIPFRTKETHLLGEMVKKFRDLGKVYDNVNLRSIVGVGEIVQDKKTSETIISIRSIQPYVDLSKLPSTLTKL